WLEVLAQRQHGDAVAAQIAHHFNDLSVGFTQADHQAGLGWNMRMGFFKALQQLQRPVVVCTGTYLTVDTRYVLQVVVEYVWWRRGQDIERAIHTATEVRHQRLNLNVR